MAGDAGGDRLGDHRCGVDGLVEITPAMTDQYADLRHPRIDPGAPLASAVANERAILQRLRDRHPSAPDDWATWENTMRIRHGDEPRRRQGTK